MSAANYPCHCFIVKMLSYYSNPLPSCTRSFYLSATCCLVQVSAANCLCHCFIIKMLSYYSNPLPFCTYSFYLSATSCLAQVSAPSCPCHCFITILSYYTKIFVSSYRGKKIRVGRYAWFFFLLFFANALSVVCQTVPISFFFWPWGQKV